MSNLKKIVLLLLVSSITHARQVFEGENLWNLTRELTQASCDVTIIQSMIIAGNFTITIPGVYCLAESVVGTITIATNNVVLDLNNKQLTGGVVVNSGVSFSTVKNGSIHTASVQGIQVNPGCRVITIVDVTIADCIQDGIFINQSSNCYVHGCSLTSNSTGITVLNSSGIIIDKSQAAINNNAGFSLLNSSTNCLIHCEAINNGAAGSGNIFGFVSQNGIGNIFEECIANGTYSVGTTSTNNIAAGFALLGTEQCSKIIHSEAGNTTRGGTPFGIYVDRLTETASTTTVGTAFVETFSTNTGDTATSVAWSPNGCFLANAHTNSLDVYKVINSSTLQLFTSVAVDYTFVDWSFDGSFILATSPAGTIDFYRFDSVNSQLVFLSTFNPGLVLRSNACWAHSSLYFIYGLTLGSVITIDCALFNPNTGTATFISSQPFNTQISGITINSVDWAPGDDYIVGTGLRTNAATAPNNVAVYPIANGIISPVVAQATYGMTTMTVGQQLGRSVAWSPVPLQDLIAVGGTPVITLAFINLDIIVYQFDRTLNTLTPFTRFPQTGGLGTFSVDWSADGNYLVAGRDFGTLAPNAQVVIFSVVAPLMNVFASTIWQSAEFVSSVAFSPNNTLIGVDGGDGSVPAGKTLSVYTSGIQALFSQINFNNIISNNYVYCTIGSQACAATGIGISADSNKNIVIGNTAYNNDVNYQFVTNVYSGGFNGIPSLLQNISVPPR